jgi:hypothetical protein
VTTASHFEVPDGPSSRDIFLAIDIGLSDALARLDGEKRLLGVKDHGRAEACLIGVAGLLREAQS